MVAHGMQQTQSLALQQVLAPQLQQSLLILQTPLLELRNLVRQEMETNPVLEELPDQSSADGPADVESVADNNFKEEFEKLASLDEEWRDYMAQSGSYSRSQETQDKRQFFFDSIPVQETLQQNLIGQLNQTALSADDRKTAEMIIGNIDDNGFLQSTPRMNISVEEVQKAADKIARLNPRPGQIFAAAPQNYVLPDVTVGKVDGEYQIILNNEQIPHLRISNLYKDIIAQDNNGEVKD